MEGDVRMGWEQNFNQSEYWFADREGPESSLAYRFLGNSR